MSDLQHAREILEVARRDLRALRAMDDANSFPDEIFGFHAQQAVEKTLKAWLAFLGETFPKTHDLMRLIEILRERGERVDALEQFVELNAFAVQYRYESLYFDEDPLDRLDVVSKIESLLERIATIVDG